jgi:hypothetical protein
METEEAVCDANAIVGEDGAIAGNRLSTTVILVGVVRLMVVPSPMTPMSFEPQQ